MGILIKQLETSSSRAEGGPEGPRGGGAGVPGAQAGFYAPCWHRGNRNNRPSWQPACGGAETQIHSCHCDASHTEGIRATRGVSRGSEGGQKGAPGGRGPLDLQYIQDYTPAAPGGSLSSPGLQNNDPKLKSIQGLKSASLDFIPTAEKEPEPAAEPPGFKLITLPLLHSKLFLILFLLLIIFFYAAAT